LAYYFYLDSIYSKDVNASGYYSDLADQSLKKAAELKAAKAEAAAKAAEAKSEVETKAEEKAEAKSEAKSTKQLVKDIMEGRKYFDDSVNLALNSHTNHNPFLDELKEQLSTMFDEYGVGKNRDSLPKEKAEYLLKWMKLFTYYQEYKCQLVKIFPENISLSERVCGEFDNERFIYRDVAKEFSKVLAQDKETRDSDKDALYDSFFNEVSKRLKKVNKELSGIFKPYLLKKSIIDASRIYAAHSSRNFFTDYNGIAKARSLVEEVKQKTSFKDIQQVINDFIFKHMDSHMGLIRILTARVRAQKFKDLEMPPKGEINPVNNSNLEIHKQIYRDAIKADYELYYRNDKNAKQAEEINEINKINSSQEFERFNQTYKDKRINIKGAGDFEISRKKSYKNKIDEIKKSEVKLLKTLVKAAMEEHKTSGSRHKDNSVAEDLSKKIDEIANVNGILLHNS